MRYTIRGNLSGAMCDDCSEPLTGVVVRFYAAAQSPEAAARAAAGSKDTVELLDAATVSEKGNRLVGEATVAADGTFAVPLSDSYDGGLLDVDFYCGTLPGHPRPHGVPEISLHVTTLAPRWVGEGDDLQAAYVEQLSTRIWCWLKALLGWWTICGQVVFCKGGEPIPGATVAAFDVDWLQDDALGSAVTDASGHFRIDYVSDVFKRTPWSPTFNFELVGGPDVYFSITAPGGAVLLAEPRSQGRTAGRQNIGPCFCVHLCVDGSVPPNPPTVPVWTAVGHYLVDPIVGAFAANGTTTVGSRAFTSDLLLNGIMPDPLSSQAVEYRFLVAEYPGLIDAPLTGAALPSTEIGILEYYAWDGVAAVFKTTPFYLNNPGAVVAVPQSSGPDLVVPVSVASAVDGWIPAPRLNELFLGGRGRFQPTYPLATLSTRAFTNEVFDLTAGVPVPLPLDAGEALPASMRSAKPLFRVTFQSRDAASHAAASSDVVLPHIALSNVSYKYAEHPYWGGGDVTNPGVVSLGVTELAVGGGCADIGDEMHLLWSVYHPYAGPPSIGFVGNPIIPTPPVLALAGGESTSGTAGVSVDMTLSAHCAYIVSLSMWPQLTNGTFDVGGTLTDQIAICRKKA